HTPIPGRDLVRNALAAIAVATNDGLSAAEAVDALAAAAVQPRLKVRKARNGATVLDDCYNASPASMLAALDVLSQTNGRHLALRGEVPGAGSEEEAGPRGGGEGAAGVLTELFTVGDRAATIAEAARLAGLKKVRHFRNKQAAITTLETELRPDDVLLVKASH